MTVGVAPDNTDIPESKNSLDVFFVINDNGTFLESPCPIPPTLLRRPRREAPIKLAELRSTSTHTKS